MGNSIEWIGKVPNGWSLNRIQNCIQEVKIKNNPIQTTQVLSLVKDKGILLYENKGNQGNKAKEDVSEYKLAYPNTMIVNSMNILIGAVGISDYFGCVSPVYYVFKEKDNSDIRFINYIFNTREFQKELRKFANGILEIRLRVSAADIFKRLIALPGKEEQHRIADFLDMKCNEIDGLIEDIEEQICILEDYKRAVITETMFSEECDCTKLKYVGSFQNGMNFISKVSDNEIPFLGVGDFQNNMVLSGREAFSSIMYDGVIPYSALLKNDDIVFVRSNGSKSLVGRSVLVRDIDFDLTYSGFCIRFRKQRVDFDSKFILYAMWSNKFREVIDSYTRGTNITNVSQDMLKNVLLPEISLHKQLEIVKKLDVVCAEIDNSLLEKNTQRDILCEYKKSLIYEYVTGKKEVI
ncbi:MAG: restriction endonuclease subunit S [Waltera sp.]|jgi:type I restriction enzyme S subunit|uniref:restriction endonuclease subunit S n=1 Tax=Waltera sp. TaxID=2815806 RepID=UPI00399ABE23